jgi:hypothetical protein
MAAVFERQADLHTQQRYGPFNIGLSTKAPFVLRQEPLAKGETNPRRGLDLTDTLLQTSRS